MSDLRLEEGIKAIQDLGDINGELNILVDFLNNTTRGIVVGNTDGTFCSRSRGTVWRCLALN